MKKINFDLDFDGVFIKKPLQDETPCQHPKLLMNVTLFKLLKSEARTGQPATSNYLP